MAYFGGQPAIVHRPGGQINVYYGGETTNGNDLRDHLTDF